MAASPGLVCCPQNYPARRSHGASLPSPGRGDSPLQLAECAYCILSFFFRPEWILPPLSPGSGARQWRVASKHPSVLLADSKSSSSLGNRSHSRFIFIEPLHFLFLTFKPALIVSLTTLIATPERLFEVDIGI